MTWNEKKIIRSYVPTLIVDQRNLRVEYLKNGEENKVDLSYFRFFNIMTYFIYTDLISSLLDQRLVDPGSTLIHVGA